MSQYLEQLSQEELTLFNSNYEIINGHDVNKEYFTLNDNIINHIKSTFNTVKGTVIEENNFSGQTLDIEKYLQYKMDKKFSPKKNPDREFFNIIEEKKGMTIGILVDVGIIINEEKNRQVRNCIASIFKGLSQIENMKLEVYTYTGDLHKSNAKMNLIVNEIKSIDDCEKIVIPKHRRSGSTRSRYYSGRCGGVSGDIGSSPTFLAIDYITKKLKKAQMDDQKTTLIVITEGRPNSVSSNGYGLIDELTVQKLTYRSVTKAQANNISTFVITLTSSELAVNELKMMFKKNVVSGYGNNLEKELMKKIDEFIIEVNQK